MSMRACTQTCEYVSGYIPPNVHTVYARVGGGVEGGCVFVCVHAFVRAGDSVSAKVLCLSVCQFDFALYH